MIGISCHPFDAEKQDVLERPDVGILVRVRIQGYRFALFDQFSQLDSGGEVACLLGKTGVAAGSLDLRFEGIPQGHSSFDQGDKALRIEVDVGQSGKNPLHGENIDLVVHHSHFAACHRHQGQALQRVNQQVLKGRDLVDFTANPYDLASFTFYRLFTLITKHDVSSG